MKRNLFYIAVVLAILMLCSSCNTKHHGVDAVTDESVCQTEVSREPEETEDEIPKEMFRFEDGLCIVCPYNAGDTLKLACELIADTVKEKYGFEVRVISDRENSGGAEIVVGLCSSRPESLEFGELVKTKGCGFSVYSDRKIIVSGKNADKILAAACLFQNKERLFHECRGFGALARIS